MPPGEGTTVVHAYTSLSGACRACTVRAAARRPWHHTQYTHTQVPLDGRLCQALSGAASGSIVLTVLRPTVSVDKLLRASTKLMHSRRQQGGGASSDSALSGPGSSRHLASALSGAGSSAAVVPAAGGEHRVDVGGGGDDGVGALACTTALTAAAGTRTGTGSGGCESRTLAPPRRISPSTAPAKDLQPSRQSRTTCTTTTTTGASSPRLGSPEIRASPTASPRGAGLLAEVDELSWRGAEPLAC